MSGQTTDHDKKTAAAAVNDAGLESNGNADFGVGSQADAVDRSYLRALKSGSFYRSVLFQMIMFGAYVVYSVRPFRDGADALLTGSLLSVRA